jgi:hypothetical protein
MIVKISCLNKKFRGRARIVSLDFFKSNFFRNFFRKTLAIRFELCLSPQPSSASCPMFSSYFAIIPVLIVLCTLFTLGLRKQGYAYVFPRFIRKSQNFACHVTNLSSESKGSIIPIMRIDLTNPVKYLLHKYNMNNLYNSFDMWFSNLVPKILLDMQNLIRCGITATIRNIRISKYANSLNKHSFNLGADYPCYLPRISLSKSPLIDYSPPHFLHPKLYLPPDYSLNSFAQNLFLSKFPKSYAFENP